MNAREEAIYWLQGDGGWTEEQTTRFIDDVIEEAIASMLTQQEAEDMGRHAVIQALDALATKVSQMEPFIGSTSDGFVVSRSDVRALIAEARR